MHECIGHTGTWRFPVVVGPPENIIVLFVLCLQPLNERFEILHEWLGTHFGLASDHGHSLGPRLTEAQLHHITANISTGQRGGSEGKRISSKSVCRRDNYTHGVKHVFTSCTALTMLKSFISAVERQSHNHVCSQCNKINIIYNIIYGF